MTIICNFIKSIITAYLSSLNKQIIEFEYTCKKRVWKNINICCCVLFIKFGKVFSHRAQAETNSLCIKTLTQPKQWSHLRNYSELISIKRKALIFIEKVKVQWVQRLFSKILLKRLWVLMLWVLIL